MRHIRASLLVCLPFLTLTASACTAENPLFDNAADPPAYRPPNAEAVKCPVSETPGNAGTPWGFHPDATHCPLSVCVPYNANSFDRKECAWIAYDPANPIVYVGQAYASTVSSPWTVYPRTDPTPMPDRKTNTWYQFRAAQGATDVYSALANSPQDGSAPVKVGFDRLRIDLAARMLIRESCPGGNGFGHLWQ